MVTEELRAIVAAAGLTPDHTNVTQLLAALQKLEVVGNIGQKSLTATGYILLPGGLIVQWGRNRSTAGAATPVVFPTAFPNQAFIVVTSHGNVSSVDNNAIGINLTLTGFDLWVFRTDGTSGDSIAADWIAIGI
ncbi:MAG: hypothetical protein D6717_00390 [Gammaproteobacteria bacterium]|nr:MAG: hypothetical protein D6717_00390 [Gammaproteobacteria bacterium]